MQPGDGNHHRSTTVNFNPFSSSFGREFADASNSIRWWWSSSSSMGSPNSIQEQISLTNDSENQATHSSSSPFLQHETHANAQHCSSLPFGSNNNNNNDYYFMNGDANPTSQHPLQFPSSLLVVSSFRRESGDGSGGHEANNIHVLSSPTLPPTTLTTGATTFPTTLTLPTTTTTTLTNNHLNHLDTSFIQPASSFLEIPQYFAISCINCRKQHRKCSKHLPSCVECRQRGVECVYRESKRVKSSSTGEEKQHSRNSNKQKESSSSSTNHANKDKNVKYKPYEKVSGDYIEKRREDHESHHVVSAFTEFDEETGHLNKRDVLEFYYEFACDGCPCFPREEFEKFLYTSPLSSNESFTANSSSKISSSGKEINFEQNTNTENTPSRYHEEWFAIFLSVRALCECRYGLSELAEKSAQKAKNVLSKMFDQFNNYNVAVVYGNLAIYEAWSGRIENAKFYIQILSYCLNSLFSDETKRENMNVYEKNLQSIVFYFTNIIGDHFEKMGIQQVIQRIPEIFSFFTGKQCPVNWLKLLQQEITSENCFEIWNVIQVIIDDLKQVVINSVQRPSTKQAMACYGYSKEYSCMIEPVFTLFSHSVKISILAKSSSPLVKGIIEKCALEITQLTDHEAFPLFPVEIVACILVAGQIHVQIVKMLLQQDSTDFVYNNTNYFEILQKDLRAIDILRKRYKILSKFNHVIREVEECAAMIKAKVALSTLQRDVILSDPNESTVGDLQRPILNGTQQQEENLDRQETNFLLFEDMVSANLLSSDDLNNVFDFE